MTRLAFLAEASTSPAASVLRGSLAPLAAPVAPAVPRHRRLVAVAVRLVSQLQVSYRDSPLSVNCTPRPVRRFGAGERLPDRIVMHEARRVRLHDLLAEPGVHVLLDRDAHLPQGLTSGPLVRVHPVSGLPDHGLIAVRPDG